MCKTILITYPCDRKECNHTETHEMQVKGRVAYIPPHPKKLFKKVDINGKKQHLCNKCYEERYKRDHEFLNGRPQPGSTTA